MGLTAGRLFPVREGPKQFSTQQPHGPILAIRGTLAVAKGIHHRHGDVHTTIRTQQEFLDLFQLIFIQPAVTDGQIPEPRNE